MPTAELLGQSSLATRGSELKVSNTFGAGCIIIYCEWSAVAFEPNCNRNGKLVEEWFISLGAIRATLQEI